MAQLTVCLILLLSCCVFKGNFQEVCEKDVTKVQEEVRRCANPCSPSQACRNKRARCLCDGACGFVCIAPGHTCGKPEDIKYGSVSVPDSLEFLAEIRYKCDDGYDLIGGDKRSCRGDGQWSGDDPFCAKSGVRCKVPLFEIPNAHLVDEWSVKEEYFEGEELSYECDIGYSDFIKDQHVTVCTVEGDEARWTQISPNCDPKTCPRPEKIRNGFYEGTDFSFGKSVTYSCNPGYNLFGASSLLCLGDEWASFAPECQPIICPKPPKPNRGTVKFEEPLKYRANAWYQCDSGYVLSGDRVRICGEDGKWSGKETECVEAKCEEPPAPKNGHIQAHSGNAVNDHVEYACNRDTTTNGIMTSICTVDADTAKWSVPPPVCTPNCVIKDLENAYATSTSTSTSSGKPVRKGNSFPHGSSIRFQCDDGYEMPSISLTNERTLDAKCEDGHWSKEIECTAARCFKWKIENNKLNERYLKLPSNIASAVPSGSVVLLDCQATHPEKEVDSFLRCSHGRWTYPSKHNEKCTKRPCDVSSLTLPHGKISLDWRDINPRMEKTIAHNKELKFECTEVDYELYKNNIAVDSLSDKSIKCEDSKLPRVSFECKPGRCTCNDLSNLVSGKGMETSNCRAEYIDSGKTIQLRCSHGFSGPTNSLEAICSRKKWSVDVKCIQNCDCSKLKLDKSLKITGHCDGQVENGKKFVLECAPDYGNFAGGRRIVECLGGRWEIPNAYCEAPCYTPDINDAGVFVAAGRKFVKVEPNTTIGAGNEIMITCLKGYELDPPLYVTKSRVVCRNGKFAVIPRCNLIYAEITTRRYPSRGSSTNSYQTASVTLLKTTTELPESSNEMLTTEFKSIEEEFQTTEASTSINNCNGDCEETGENGDFTDENSNSTDNDFGNVVTTTEDTTQKVCFFKYETDENLMAYQDEELLTSDVVLFAKQSLHFRCKDINMNVLIGTIHLICGENGWLARVPRCEVLSHRNPDKAPVVTYKILNGEHYIAPNGSLVISEDASMELDCWWFQNRHGDAKWFWNKDKETNAPHISTRWKGNGNFLLQVDSLKKRHEGVYSCVNPKGQEHAIDVRVMEKKIQPTTLTKATTLLTTTYRSFQTLRPITTRIIKPPTTTTKLTTTQPTTTIKEEYLTDCNAQSSKDLIIYENGVELDREKLTFPTSTSLVFRCRYFSTRKMKGINKVQCHKGRWSQSWPTCDEIYPNNWNSPPPVSITTNFGELPQLDNGDYLLQRGTHLYFLCFFYPAQPDMYVNNVLVKKNIRRNEGSKPEDIYWFYDVGKYYTAAVLTFKCYVPRGYKDDKYANSVTARFGGHCFLTDEGKTKLKLRFSSAVLLPSSLRPVYAEGDIVNFGCSKRFAQSSYIPEGMRCTETGVWELQSTKQTLCN